MKKFLLTAALVLALVVSLTAGTMAFYNATVTTNTDVNTKKFVYSVVNAGDSYISPVSIAPGDTRIYKFTVANQSELDLLSQFTTSFKWGNRDIVDNSTIPGLSVVVTRVTTTDSTLETVPANDNSRDISLVMKPHASDTYTVTIKWDYNTGVANDGSTAAASQYAGQALKLSVSAYGRQTVGYGTSVDEIGHETNSQYVAP